MRALRSFIAQRPATEGSEVERNVLRQSAGQEMSKENGMIGCIGHDGDCCKDREELERDAARYRWLKERFFGADFDWNKSGSCAIVFEWPEGSRISADLNKSIDDVMPNTDNTLANCGAR